MPAGVDISPADLQLVPEVAEVLERQGWGSLLAEGLVAFQGRNENWAGTTSTGVGVFIKKIDGPDAAARFRRAVAFTRLADESAAAVVSTPSCLAFDETSRVLVFEWLEGARPVSELVRDGEFTGAMAGEAGRMVGRLHRSSLTDGMDASAPSWPRLNGLALDLSLFTECSAAQLELFGLVQRDEELVAAVRRLAERSRVAPMVPVHCDLRLDQFLCSEGKLYLADWEELRAEDPARDVGAFVGEWVYRAVRAISEDGAATATTVIPRGVQELERRRPFLDAFWKGYVDTRGPCDPELASRSAAYAGWHLLDRVLAGSLERVRLHALDRAAVGIARRILLAPDAFCGVLGLSTPAGTVAP